MDGANNAYVLWEDYRNTSTSQGKTDIYFGKRPAATGTWSADRQVNDDRGGSAAHSMPRIAVRADGSAVAVWVDDRSQKHNIYSARLAAGASAWGTNMRVTSDTAAFKSLPDVVIGPDGAAHAVWQDQRNGNADVYYAKLPAGGSAWSANVKVSDDPGMAIQFDPRIGVDGAGNLLVIWWDNRTSPAQIRMSRLLAGSSIWEPSRVVSDPAARPQGTEGLAVRADGSAFAGWLDSRGAGFDQAPVYGSDYDPATVTWTVSQVVTTARSSGSPAVAADSTQVALVWTDGEFSSGFPPNILYRRRTSGPGVDHFSYAYDGLNRLTSVAGPTVETFALDAATNIASRTGPPATNSFDTANRQATDGTRGFVWSPADRLVQRGADTFAYDPLARLMSATVAGSTRAYTYNGDGLLATAAGTSYLWDAATAPAALLQAGADKVVYGLGPLYGVRADASTYTFARDGLGSVRAEVGDNGSVTKSFRYAAYGAIVQSAGGSPTLLGFAGELLDASGLIYLRARWYDPTVGRFISRDPFAGNVRVPTTFNGFAYASGAPTMLVDPLGLDPQSIRPGTGSSPSLTFLEVAGAILAGVGGAVSTADALRDASSTTARTLATTGDAALASRAGRYNSPLGRVTQFVASPVFRTVSRWLPWAGLAIGFASNLQTGYSLRDAAILAAAESGGAFLAGVVAGALVCGAETLTGPALIVLCPASVVGLSIAGGEVGRRMGQDIIGFLPPG